MARWLGELVEEIESENSVIPECKLLKRQFADHVTRRKILHKLRRAAPSELQFEISISHSLFFLNDHQLYDNIANILTLHWLISWRP